MSNYIAGMTVTNNVTGARGTLHDYRAAQREVAFRNIDTGTLTLDSIDNYTPTFGPVTEPTPYRTTYQTMCAFYGHAAI